jgi:hypothetical protein
MLGGGAIMVRVRRDFSETKRALAWFDAKARKSLFMQAGYIRKAARNSMKVGKRGKPSAPGQPPHAITRLLKDFLFFSWDPGTKSMVIGPAGIRNSSTPRILEEGGVKDNALLKRGAKWVRGSVQIQPRPYMLPAMQRSQEKLSEFWSNSVRSA